MDGPGGLCGMRPSLMLVLAKSGKMGNLRPVVRRSSVPAVGSSHRLKVWIVVDICPICS